MSDQLHQRAQSVKGPLMMVLVSEMVTVLVSDDLALVKNPNLVFSIVQIEVPICLRNNKKNKTKTWYAVPKQICSQISKYVLHLEGMDFVTSSKKFPLSWYGVKLVYADQPK